MEVGASTANMGPQIYALKKATEVQSEAVIKTLEGSGVQSAQTQKSNGSGVTGIGQNLDIKA